jgi:subtilisin family serine protease
MGGAPKAKFLAQGLWSSLLGGLTVPPVASEMLNKAYEEGVRVHSNSWGSPKSPGVYDAFAVQIDEFVFANPDFLILFAAGNSGADLDKDGRIDPNSVTSPGTAKNALTIGSSENKVAKGGIQKKLADLNGGPETWGAEPLRSDLLSNNPSGLAAFSSRGPTNDGRIKPDIVAPGTNILSTRSHFPEAETLWGAYNGDYVWSGGTSMSTPLVAGAAVLVREYLIKEKAIERPSAALVKNVLMHSAVDLFPGQFGTVGKALGQELLKKRPNPHEGWGRVDVGRATALNSALIFDEKAGVGTGEAMTYPLSVKRDGKVVASLVWTDAPGSPTVEQALVNDLDLAIVNANGRELAPMDRINNSELIEVPVSAGDFEIQVRGVNVPQGANGKQPFALVVSME